MPPIVLFGIQFTLSLAAYTLIAWWYVAPRLSGLPREVALMPLLWVHAFRIVGGTILAPGAVDAAVPAEFRTMIGYGDITTAVLALIALLALRYRLTWAIALVWVCLTVGMPPNSGQAIQMLNQALTKGQEIPERALTAPSSVPPLTELKPKFR